MKRFEQLTQYIPLLKQKDFGGWMFDKTSKGTKEDPIIWPHVNYSYIVCQLEHDIYEYCHNHPEYNHQHYNKNIGEYGIQWEADSMSNADVKSLPAKTVLSLLIGALRAERFCDGALLEFLENGSILRWLERLEQIDQEEKKGGSMIQIKKIGITKLKADAVVNAANSKLLEGGGVCGYIFHDAGSKEMTKACSKYDHCDTGNAVITPGFNLPAKYVIHAVGPIYIDGNHNEKELLYNAYFNSLKLARKNDIHSIGFPLISSGIYGYPKKQAWETAIQACKDFIQQNNDYSIDIIFTVLDDYILQMGQDILSMK